MQIIHNWKLESCEKETCGLILELEQAANEPSPVGYGAEQPPEASPGSSVRADQKGETEFIRWLGGAVLQTDAEPQVSRGPRTLPYLALHCNSNLNLCHSPTCLEKV